MTQWARRAATRASPAKTDSAGESKAIRLTQIERMLGCYLRGLLELSASITGVPEPTRRWRGLLRLLPTARAHGVPSVYSYTDGVAVYLPTTVELLPHRDDNLRLYKVMALLCAAQVLQGSLEYVRWFMPSTEKRLALDLFVLLEDARLERMLSRQFRGLADDLSVLRRQVWEMRPAVGDAGSKDAVVEALVQHLLLGATRQRLAPARCALLEEMLTKIARRPLHLALDAARLSLELAEDLRSVHGTYHPCVPVLHWPQIRPELVLSVRQGNRSEEKAESGSRSPGQAGGTRVVPENARATKRQGRGVSLRGALPRDLSGARGSSAGYDVDTVDQDGRRISGSQPPEKVLSAQTVEPSGRHAPTQVSLRDWAAQSERDGDGQVFVYHEWDYRVETYRSGACLLRQGPIPISPGVEAQSEIEPDRVVSRHIRRQFELMRPERRWRRRELDGEKIDLDAVVEAVVDRHAGLSPEERLYIARSERVRDIAVALLVDLSASTETWVKDVRRVIDVEKESLLVVCAALEAAGDTYAIYGFSSKVEKGCAFYRIKGFGENYGQEVQSRIQMLAGRGYTRMGVAVRHVARILSATEARVKLLLVLSDGKPNEVGIYQGRYAVEDTRQAVLEARALGIFPFGLTIDRGDRSYLPRIFGHRGYAVIADVLELPVRLADVYRRLTS